MSTMLHTGSRRWSLILALALAGCAKTSGDPGDLIAGDYSGNITTTFTAGGTPTMSTNLVVATFTTTSSTMDACLLQTHECGMCTLTGTRMDSTFTFTPGATCGCTFGGASGTSTLVSGSATVTGGEVDATLSWTFAAATGSGTVTQTFYGAAP